MSLETLQKWLKFNYMKFIKKFYNAKFILLSAFLFVYVLLNLFDGERGLISFIAKQKIKDNLMKEQTILLTKLKDIESKNELLSEAVDLDYLETLYRKKFMVGKSAEKIYIK